MLIQHSHYNLNVYKPLAIKFCAIFLIPALFSNLTASSHNNGVCGFFNRAFSRIDRALINCPVFSSSLDNSNHSGMALGHFFNWITKHETVKVCMKVLTMTLDAMTLETMTLETMTLETWT